MSNLLFSDISLLRRIQKMYEAAYLANKHKQDAFMYVPISCHDVAKEMNADDEAVFQRLNFHLNKKYGYTQRDGSLVELFARAVGEKNNCINYPYLCAILKNLEDDERRSYLTMAIACVSIIISIIALFK